MLGIMAGMDQNDSYVVCSLQGRRHPCRGAEVDSHVLDCSADH